MMSRWSRIAARRMALIAVLGVASCRDTTAPPAPLPGDLRAVAAAGAAQVGTVGLALRDSVVVSVTGAGGAPVGGIVLEWRLLDASAGELMARTTRTDARGRAANVWVLGPTAGVQRVEIRAVLGDVAVTLDTIEATARPGEAATLRVVGDSVVDVAVGDSARVTVEGADRFGNRVPDAGLGVKWASLHPAIAAVDGAGVARAVGFGLATLEARSGGAVARVRVRVRERVESYLVAAKSYDYVSGIEEHAGRVVAVSTASYRTMIVSTVWELVGGTWSAAPAFSGSSWDPWLHVTPAGVAYAHATRPFNTTLVSPRPGSWSRESSAFDAWRYSAAAGDILFGAAQRDATPWRVERWEAGTLTDLALPAPYNQYVSGLYPLREIEIAAPSSGELYVSVAAGTAWWKGQAWSGVPRPDGGGAFALRLLTGAAGQGGVAYGVLGTNLLYRLADGRAERVPNPLELEGRSIDRVAVSEAGEPLLAGNGAVYFRIGGEWREYRLPDGYGVDALAWGEKGTIWLALAHATDEMGYYGPYRELRFLHLVVQR
jgi:hypothetical protein